MDVLQLLIIRTIDFVGGDTDRNSASAEAKNTAFGRSLLLAHIVVSLN